MGDGEESKNDSVRWGERSEELRPGILTPRKSATAGRLRQVLGVQGPGG